MNYKKIFKSRSLRFRILKALSWIPDKIMLRIQYKIQTGHTLNLKNPKRFTEKIQWYKINYKNDLMLQCADKYEVRKYVSSKGLDDILIPLIGIYDNLDLQILERLPNRFVLKTTDGGGGEQVYICRDKSKIDINTLLASAIKWKNIKRINAGREWAYQSPYKSRYIVEDLIGADEADLIDYKFLCFNGEPYCLYALSERILGLNAQLGIYDMNFNKLPVEDLAERTQKKLPKPINFDKMVEIAKILSSEFPHVRVDLYNISGKIYFGELTFYDSSGYIKFNPDKFDFELGNQFFINNIKI